MTEAVATTARPPTRRLVVRGAPALYVLALVGTVVTYGLPLAHDQLFFWIALGLIAVGVGRPLRITRLVLEWLPILLLLVLYDVLRGAVGGAPEQAHRVAQVAVDEALTGGVIPSVWLQDRLWTPGDPRWYDYAVWGVYMTHFFAVWTVAAVIWHRAHEHFRRFATLAVTLTLAAFLTYWLYPAQPPWLVAQDGGIPPVDRTVPAVWGELGVGSLQSTYEDAGLVNTVAAMPSLHAAYPCLLLLFFWAAGRWVRAGLALYTLAMGFTLVYGGEHFVLDIFAGWAMAAGTYALVALAPAAVRRRRRTNVLLSSTFVGSPTQPPANTRST